MARFQDWTTCVCRGLAPSAQVWGKGPARLLQRALDPESGNVVSPLLHSVSTSPSPFSELLKLWLAASQRPPAPCSHITPPPGQLLTDTNLVMLLPFM